MSGERRRTPDGYQHAEAFRIMKYATLTPEEATRLHSDPGPNPRVVEFLWNSRDGVTPFGISTRDGEHEMLHTEFGADRLDPYYPHRGLKVGDRIFIDATPEIVRGWVERRFESYKTGSDDCPWSTDAEREALLSKIVADESANNPPAIVVVDEAMLEKLQRTIPQPPRAPLGSGRFA